MFEKIYKKLFCSSWGVIILMQLLFVAGLVGASDLKWGGLFAGVVWFGLSTFWMVGQSQEWDKNCDC